MKKIFAPFHLLLVAAVIALSACERPAEVDVPITPSKLVVNSWISPDDTVLNVFVSRSVPMFGVAQQRSPFPEDADVRMSDGINSVQLSYDFNDQTYKADMGALNMDLGRTYYLSVTQNGETATSETNIPPVPAVISEASASYTSQDQQQFSNIVLNLKTKWLDPQPNVYNYYALEVYSVFYNTDGTENISTSEFFLLSDANLVDGSITYRPYFEIFDPSSNTNSFIRYRLMTVNKDYYEFHRTAQLNQESGGPFSEPVLLYSNVKGGLGAFGGYVSTWVEVPVVVE